MKNLIKISLLFSVIFLWTSCGPGEVEKVSMFVGDTFVEEGNSGTATIRFQIRLATASAVDIMVDYATSDGTATSGEDYVATSGTATIPAGESEAIVEVTVNGDTDPEEDETVILTISNAPDADIVDDSGTATINNDDDAPISDAGYTTPDNYPGMTLVWRDEFSGTSLNTNDWIYEVGTGNSGWGNNELQSYQSGTSNAAVANGYLTITAKGSGSSYTSARIITQGNQSFQYGRIDIRAKLPKGQGLWPALWMLGDNFSSVGWPSCGEIDIMELVGHEANKVHGTVHWSDPAAGGSLNHASYGGSTVLASGDFSDEFNVFSIIWDSQSIKWLMNDTQYHVIDITGPELTEFHQKFFFIFNVAVGGNWPGSPNASTVFPQEMVVDYVRVFQ